MNRKRVLFLVNIPAPYRVSFFNELSKYCDLTVLLESQTAEHRDNDWLCRESNSFHAVYLNSIGTKKRYFCPGVLKYVLDKSYDMVIVGVYNTLTSILAMHAMRMSGISFIISVDGGMIKHDNIAKRSLKRYLIGGADSWLSPSQVSDEYLVYYGAKKENIVRYHFTSLSNSDLLEADKLRQKRDSVRCALGMHERIVLLTVGRFNLQGGYGKGYDTVMELAERLPPDVGVYFVGDEPTPEFSDWKENKSLDNVHFIGYEPKHRLNEYYAAADIFLLLTRGDVWGLVVNEAMSFSLPVITTDVCVAGLELIRDGVNGFIVEPGNPEEALNRIECLLSDHERRESLGRRARSAVADYSIENMVTDHLQLLTKWTDEQ